jgi:long-chain acyl-CoA synthetase
MLEWRASHTPYAWAYKYPDEHDSWLKLTWKEAHELAQQIAAALLQLGLQYEERVAIISQTRIEWVLADFGINIAGGATTAIYPNTAGEDFDHILTDSQSAYVIAENSDQLLKLLQYPKFKDQIRKVILLEGEYASDKVITWKELLELGKRHLAAEPEAVKAACEKVTPATLATLVYTSGTTGMPKGVELLHSNWAYEAWAVNTLGLIDSNATLYFWLPLSHVFGKDIMTIQLAIGFCSAVDGRVDKIVPNLAVVKPDVMLGVPRIFEKVRSAVMLSFPRNSIKGRIARWAFSVGRDSRDYRLNGKPMPVHLKAAYAVADKLVFSALKEKMGGNIKFMVSGSAKLSRRVQGWFYSAGITVIEGYGLTETTAIAMVAHWRDPAFGTVGKPLPGTEVKIAEDGEICIKGGLIMRGYHNNPELTAEAITDGWFHTGDIGKIDEYGNVQITDRKKDLMKTSGGKYVAPARVETVMSSNIPYVSQVVAVGDGRKYISALFTMDSANVMQWAKRRGMDDLSFQEVLDSDTFRHTMNGYVKRANERLEHWETVKRFAMLPNEFTVDEGVVTPSLKIRRQIIAKQYAKLVDSLYDDDGDEITDDDVVIDDVPRD